MSVGAEGERFLAAFSKVKTAVADDPAKLNANWQDSQELQILCDELAQLVQGFETVEERSPLAFTNHVSAASALARRDYDDRWRNIVTKVANRTLATLLAELLGDDFEGDDCDSDAATIAPQNPLAAKIADWKQSASEEAGQIKQIIDYVLHLREMDDSGDRDWIDEGLIAWDRLEVSGLDIAGTLWRRRALPHVLVPVHVAKHYGASRASLYRRLHQAGKAFVFGAPLAALALQRAVVEETLKKHWGVESGAIRDANLPETLWDRRATKLKRLANDALHGDPEKLSPDELDRAIIENFFVLRLLIENAPEKLPASSGKSS